MRHIIHTFHDTSNLCKSLVLEILQEYCLIFKLLLDWKPSTLELLSQNERWSVEAGVAAPHASLTAAQREESSPVCRKVWLTPYRQRWKDLLCTLLTIKEFLLPCFSAWRNFKTIPLNFISYILIDGEERTLAIRAAVWCASAAGIGRLLETVWGEILCVHMVCS